VPSSPVFSQNPGAEAVPNEILVQYKPGASAADKGAARGAVSAATKKALHANRGGDMEVVTVKTRSVEDAIALLKQHPSVKLAEPNYIFTVGATANDPRYTDGSLYGMYSDDTPIAYGPAGTTNEFGSHAEEAWGLGHTGSSSVVVGVIDTGIDYSHPDLAANKFVNPFETVNGLDDDGNGFVDDINGWDCVNNDNNPFDDHFHGTHVAGTIGAVGNNGIGVVGVNWTVKLMALKFLNSSGSGTLADAVECVAYATDFKQRHGTNIVATNNSWGGGGFSSALRNAIIAGADEDILFIAAAGNNGSDNDFFDFFPRELHDSARGRLRSRHFSRRHRQQRHQSRLLELRCHHS
jgi:subtilisin family serine protease